MTDEEKKKYDQALDLLFGGDFEIQVASGSDKAIASFKIENGIITVGIDDILSEICEAEDSLRQTGGGIDSIASDVNEDATKDWIKEHKERFGVEPNLFDGA